MTASNRLAITLAAAATAAALATGCTAASGVHPTPAPKDGTVATTSFSAAGLAFEYPASWRSGTWNTDTSSFSTSIVDLSSSRLRDPCTVTTSPGRKTISCGYPVGALPPGGILVHWSADGWPTRQLPKANTTVGGRKAVETRTSGGWCAPLHATETITVMIPRGAPDNWYQMDACLRGPGLTQHEAEIWSMLRSVRIAKAD